MPHKFEQGALDIARTCLGATRVGNFRTMWLIDRGSGKGEVVKLDCPPEHETEMIRERCAMVSARGVARLAVGFPDAVSRYTDRVVVVVEHRDIDGGAVRVWQAKIARLTPERFSLGEWALMPTDAELPRMMPPTKTAKGN